MKRIAGFQHLFEAIGLAFGILIGRNSENWLAVFKLTPAYFFVATFILAVLMSQTLGWVASSLIEASAWLRKSILRKQWIEGTWFETIKESDGQTTFTLVEIHYRDSNFALSGLNINVKGQLASSFTTDMLVVRWPLIEYKYNARRTDPNIADAKGYGQLQFDETAKYPLEYHGYFIDVAERRFDNVSGIKVTNKSELASLQDNESKKAYLRDKLSKIAVG